MLTEERRERILDELQRTGKVLAADLSRALHVSDDTIRRDLDALAARGLLRRVYSGALRTPPVNTDYVARQGEGVAAKEAVARATAALIRPGQVIILDGGTTTLAVARYLPRDLAATVVTTSPPVAVALAEHTNIEVITIGGRLYRYPLVNVGAATIAGLRELRADLCVIGVLALDPEVGLSVLDYEEAAVKRVMIEVSADVVVPTPAAKLGTVAPFVVAPAAALTHLVTEASVSEETLAPYRALGLTVVRA
ncbi:MAG: DeoR/GlpR transcriptional regulator [Herpetosiphonaceae bacterium]|nr:DeoR/GlpR transcriptional regulator [Herpetosiphonaceae bacterium]